jgi:pyruvate dehydrogenase E2 component (dihydrolipoamide acetyltransferase)
LLAEIETDKATMGFETPEEGYLAKILYAAGSKDIPIGKLVCIIVENEGDVAAFKDFKDDGAASTPKPAAAAAPSPPPSPSVAAPASSPPPPPPSSRPAGVITASEQKFGDRVLASPMARRLAEQQKLRLEGRGSGLFGSLTSKDLDGMSAGSPSVGAASPSIPAGAAFIDIPVSNVRGVIAKRLLESKVTIPHYYLTVECNVDKILELRARFNKSLEKSGKKLSINDFIIKAAAIACKKVPECNSAWLGNTIRQ